MNDKLGQLLCRLADPDDNRVTERDIERHEPIALLQAIELHNVGAISIKKMRALDLEPAFDETVSRLWQNHLYMCALVVGLEKQTVQISDFFKKQKVEFAIVKGASFASNLYASKSDRPYSDIDILVPKQALGLAGQTLNDLGYQQFLREHFDKSEANQEQKWGLEGNDLMLCELHTNLVHWRPLRKKISFNYEDYVIASADMTLPNAGNFIIAIVHAAAGHKFHNLRLLVDVLQAIRKLTEDDMKHLEDAVRALKIRPEVSACLSLVSGLFPSMSNDRRFIKAWKILGISKSFQIVSPADVLNAPYERQSLSKIRRHAFRYYQASLAPRT